LPHAKVFEQVGPPLTLRVLANFLQFFLAKLDCFIDLRLGHDEKSNKLTLKREAVALMAVGKIEPH
jgi:hypothetical protein